MNRIESLRRMEYQVDNIWGCALRQEKQNVQDVQKLFTKHLGKT